MPARKRKPLVAVLDWKPAPASNDGVDIEKQILGKSARAKKRARFPGAFYPPAFRHVFPCARFRAAEIPYKTC